jgi:hypothetical protein
MCTFLFDKATDSGLVFDHEPRLDFLLADFVFAYPAFDGATALTARVGVVMLGISDLPLLPTPLQFLA